MDDLIGQKESGPSDLFARTEGVGTFLWTGLTVEVKDRKLKKSRTILSSVNGLVKEGQLMAVMGPSGSGKSTLLHSLAQRMHTSAICTEGLFYFDGIPVECEHFRRLSAYVEQEDALIGSLTVRETLHFAAQLALPTEDKTRRTERVNSLLTAFGLSDVADTVIGTSMRKGVSGGQKRRVSVASQLVTGPKLLFLDEPTSGLDSAAAFEVMLFLKEFAKKHRMIIIASIHQPATSTFKQCDLLLLLCRGHTVYNGPVEAVPDHFQNCNLPIPLHMNPAEFALDFVNTDFARDSEDTEQQLAQATGTWFASQQKRLTEQEMDNELIRGNLGIACRLELGNNSPTPVIKAVATLIHRSFLKSYRDVIVYGIRVGMYLGLAFLMGTVWLRLEPTQDNIPAFVSAIFFGGAFMSFMAVAYIPAYLEDYNTFRLENSNGLYGSAVFLMANFLTGIPFLFCITLVFSLVEYWMTNFRPAADGFFTWIMWLFLDLVAAESLVVLVSSMAPIFVVALAGTAFINGLWMCVGGSLRPVLGLNHFWRYIFHYIDYQAYVFQGMMRNEFDRRTYSCGAIYEGQCNCDYDTILATECQIKGDVVPASYGLSVNSTTTSVMAMLAIIISYRLLAWLALALKVRQKS